MNDFVELRWKRNRGWPVPESSWGLTPMFGEDGWCHSCGVPRRPQTGSLVLSRKGMARVEGAWIPNWQFDVVCLERSLADEVAKIFDVELREIAWPRAAPGEAMQMVVPTVGESWFDVDELRSAAVARHGVDGARCSDCGVWRWMPLSFDFLPPVQIAPPPDDVDVAASPEWFGDGWQAFRQVLVRRELAELIAQTSTRDFRVNEIRLRV